MPKVNDLNFKRKNEIKNDCPIDFDPFKSHIVRNSTQPQRDQSITEQALKVLETNRVKLEGLVDSVQRETEVFYPRSDNISIQNNFSAVSKEDSQLVRNLDENREDQSILAKSASDRMKKIPISDAPLTTRAIRDLEKAKKERVYSKSLIRVKFPDKLIIQVFIS